MNTKKILLFLMCLFLFNTVVCVFAETETRNIYIGDIITLEITSHQFSANELNDKFKDFEIIETTITSNGYLLSLRTFETGEHKVVLGNTETIINVSSTLEDIQRESVFEGDKRVIKPGFSFHWLVLLCVAAGVFVLSGVFVLVKIAGKRKIAALSPYCTFLKRTEALLPKIDNDNFFVYLTFYFKEYVGKLHNRRIFGKTSSEIISELKAIHSLGSVIPMIEKWLVECDRMKFTGVAVLAEEKQKHYELLLKLAEIIEGSKEVTP